MAKQRDRLPCMFCQRLDSDLTVIVSPGLPPGKQFREFIEHCHQICFTDYLKRRILPCTTSKYILDIDGA